MGERLDLISGLPAEIIRRILSFLPLQDAVRTSTLSTVWRSLWTPFQIDIDLDTNPTSHEASKEVIEIISKILRSYESPEVWKFCLTFPESKKEDEMIVLATKGAEKELLLQFSKRKIVMGQLRLEQTCQDFQGFSTLKTLHLRSVPHLAKGLVSALFSRCQLLESLKLEKCGGLDVFYIEGGNCFQSLMVLDCPDIVHITISAQNLKTFWYQGALPQIHLMNTLNLVDVTLYLKDGVGQNEFDCEEVLSLLASLKEVESLFISGWLLEVYILFFFFFCFLFLCFLLTIRTI